MKITAKEGDRVDTLVWENCGRDKGLVEAVLDHNPGLSAVAYNLPALYEFEIPDELLNPAPELKPRKHLW